MTTEILDAAYALAKQAQFGPYPDKLVAELRRQFRDLDGPTAEEAQSRAAALVSVACDWADQLRGPNNDGKGLPSFRLADCCPGFSEAAYSDAEAWGLYLTK